MCRCRLEEGWLMDAEVLVDQPHSDFLGIRLHVEVELD